MVGRQNEDASSNKVAWTIQETLHREMWDYT